MRSTPACFAGWAHGSRPATGRWMGDEIASHRRGARFDGRSTRCLRSCATRVPDFRSRSARSSWPARCEAART